VLFPAAPQAKSATPAVSIDNFFTTDEIDIIPFLLIVFQGKSHLLKPAA
jgi:hypothetical protein